MYGYPVYAYQGNQDGFGFIWAIIIVVFILFFLFWGFGSCKGNR